MGSGVGINRHSRSFGKPPSKVNREGCKSLASTLGIINNADISWNNFSFSGNRRNMPSHKDKKHPRSESIRTFAKEIESVINRHALENDLSYEEAIGTMTIIIHDLYRDSRGLSYEH